MRHEREMSRVTREKTLPGEDAMETLDSLMDLTKVTYNRVMEEWKEAGGKIIGYFCTNVPEELVMAAGMLPYRIRAPESVDTSESDRYTNYLNCTYCRHVVDEALRGKYDFLDGFIGTNGCDHMRRVCDIMRAVVFKQRGGEKEFFLEYVAAPRVPGDQASFKYYEDELVRVRQSFCDHFGVEITDERLGEAVAKVNQTRRLLKKLYELRKDPTPPVSGAESLAIVVASTCTPKDVFNERMTDLLAALDGRIARPHYRKRIFLYGSELDDPEWVKVIEDQGGLVVADGTCFGARMFWDLVDESKEPLGAIAKRYYERWSCPRMMDGRRRQARIKEFVKEWNVDGIVGERIIMCQLWGAERVMTELEARETGIPTLWLEREYVLGGVGQLKTRIQAFIESME